MVLFVPYKLILQTCMCSHPAGLDVSFLIRFFIYFHASSVWRLWRDCADAQAHLSLFWSPISTITSCAGSLVHWNYEYPNCQNNLWFVMRKLKSLCIILPWLAGVFMKLVSFGFGANKVKLSIIIWATSWENLFMTYANNKGADQPAHPQSDQRLYFPCLDSIIPILAIANISRL